MIGQRSNRPGDSERRLRRPLRRWIAVLVTSLVAPIVMATPAAAAPPGCGGGPGASYETPWAGITVHLAYSCQWLDRGQSWYFGNARMTLQNDGNLVIYDRAGRNRWSSRTSGSGATQLVFQKDNNLVLYTAGWARNVWSTRTGTVGCPNTIGRLGLQSDSNFVIYCGNWTDVLWASGTRGI